MFELKKPYINLINKFNNFILKYIPKDPSNDLNFW
jgi:hypothetical protein